MGCTVKKLFAFVVLMTLVSMLTVTTVGCSKKPSTPTGTPASTTPADTKPKPN
jgi:hypothetical protein